MKWFPLALCLMVVAMFDGRCGEAGAGEPISASDLAAQLGVHAFSFVYEQKSPFTTAKVMVVFKKLQADGTYATVAELGAAHLQLKEGLTSLPVKVLLDSEHCTLITGRSMTRGSGYEFEEGPMMSYSPPESGTDGEFVLLVVGKDPERTISLENAKGYLAVEIDTK